MEELGIVTFSFFLFFSRGKVVGRGSRAKYNNDGMGEISNYLHKIYFIRPWLLATLKESTVIN